MNQEEHEEEVQGNDSELEEELQEENISDPPQATGPEFVLDPQLWENLPIDAVYRILQHMPIACLTQCKTLCKKFYSIISSHCCCNLPRSRDHWLAISQATGGSSYGSNLFYAYDPALDSWHTFSLSFLPFNVRGLASAGGLFCCRAEINGSLSLVICNPISQRWVVLPPMIKKRVMPIVSLVVMESSAGGNGNLNGFTDSKANEQGCFKVIVAGDDLEGGHFRDLSSEVYDSVTGTWSFSGPLPPQTDLEMGSVLCNGNLYLMNYCPYGVVSLNVADGLWSKVQAPMPNHVTIPSLVGCCGRLFMVGGVLRKNVIGSIRVWELCEEEKVWKEFARMKDRMFKDLCMGMDELDLYFNAVANGSTIYLLVYKGLQVPALDVAARSWFCLPDHPITVAAEGRHLLGYSFSPKMFTVID